MLEGCAPSSEEVQEDKLRKRGILGDHPLLDLSSLREPFLEGEVSGEISGVFLFFTGGVGGRMEGEIEGGTIGAVQFAWETKTAEPEIVITELPISKVTFVRREGLQKPVVQFQFNLYELYTGGRYTSIKDFSNPNEYFTGENLEALDKAIIKLNSDDFQNLLPGTLGK